MVNLALEGNSRGPINVSVYTITGRQVINEKFSQAEFVSFSMSGQVSGIYLVKVNIDGLEYVKKLVLDRN
jgi:hypothetical protein